jgi:asparagine synthase (glutamine-hydrolysing)
MCGIFGAIRTEGSFRADEYADFCALTDMVSYRGPDDAGYVVLNINPAVQEGETFNIFLGHRRLSIIDLSAAGHQPMTDGEGCWITFNGEIFNYIELREELIALGHTFHSATDTEVILRLYKQYGETGFGRMNGMWAFGLIDLRRSRLVLSRDRFSIKPIYLASVGRDLYFSSEIKQLVPLLHSAQPNLGVMNTFLDQALTDHEVDTFYIGIDRLPAATNLVMHLRTGKSSQARYWDWPPFEPFIGDVQEHFRELLLDSIRIRLRSDVKVGVLLSGGLDSSAITLMTQLLASQVDTYSVISDGDCSEEPYADAVIAKTRGHNLKVMTVATETIESLDRVLFHNDEPLGGFNVVAQFQMMEAIRNQSDSTVLLSGQGADEVLLGYLKYFFFYLQDLKRGSNYNEALAQVLGCLLHRTVLNQFRFGAARRYRSSVCSRPFLLSCGERVRLWDSSNVRQRQITDIDAYSIPALTHYEDRSSMAFALEVRHPFLDHRLVEFAVGLPANANLHYGWTKYILRKAVPELPKKVRWRRDKQGFPVPEKHWLKQDCAPMMERLFAKSALAEMGVLDAPKFLACYRQFCAGSEEVWHSEFTRVLIAEVWSRRFRSNSTIPQSDCAVAGTLS